MRKEREIGNKEIYSLLAPGKMFLDLSSELPIYFPNYTCVISMWLSHIMLMLTHIHIHTRTNTHTQWDQNWKPVLAFLTPAWSVVVLSNYCPSQSFRAALEFPWFMILRCQFYFLSSSCRVILESSPWRPHLGWRPLSQCRSLPFSPRAGWQFPT